MKLNTRERGRKKNPFKPVLKIKDENGSFTPWRSIPGNVGTSGRCGGDGV